MRGEGLIGLAMALAVAGGASAQSGAPTPGFEACTLVVDADDGAVIARSGPQCEARNSPASTFKVALAVIGFQSGYLKGPHDPVLPYKPQYKAEREAWRTATDPTRWLAESVVWYSQAMTRTLGMAKFQQGVDALNYGNRDLTGDPGMNNGLTNAWLSSSLQISPVEQAAFLRRMLDHKLPVAPAAVDQAMAIMPTFTTGGWTVRGKTGTGFQPRPGGGVDRDRQFGWFVGWAERGTGRGARRVVFVRLIKDTAPATENAGFRARDRLLADLPRLVG